MDWIWLAVLIMGLVSVILISEVVRKKFHWSTETTRKFVHIFTGLFIGLSPVLLQESFPLLCVTSIFIVLNFIAIRKGWMPGMHATEHISYGTVFYPLSFFILILLLWDNYKSVLIISMLIMAIADAIAAIVGERVKNPLHYKFSGERKSIQGSAAMLITTFLITFAGLKFIVGIDHNFVPTLHAFWFAAIVSIIATACESISYKGSDNLSVPLGAAFAMHYLLSHSAEQNVAFTFGVTLALFIALISYRLRFLKGSGAVATFLLGSVVFGIGGWEFSLPLLLFFVLSSLLSKIGKKQKKKFADTFQKGGQRDLGQVFANGGIAGIIVLLWNYFPGDVWYLAFVGSIAAVTADTWSTEIGIFSRLSPRNILNFKRVAPGTSGGVTPIGTLGGLLGSFVIVFVGSLVTKRYEQLPLFLPFFIVAAGLFGSVVDSVVGATIQAQFQCPNCGKITEKKEHCQAHQTTLVSGLNFIDNDVVNALCALSGALFAWAVYLFFT